MELSNLTGVHELSGVELGQMIIHDMWEGDQNCQFVKFTLDGVHYIAAEDPDDGYRSRCRDLIISDEPPRYRFPPQTMRCYMRDDQGHFEDDILIMQDITTKDTVLEIGTSDYNDFYPMCHFIYNPENMACNVPDISEESFNKIISN